jgi:hypothetical protein
MQTHAIRGLFRISKLVLRVYLLHIPSFLRGEINPVNLVILSKNFILSKINPRNPRQNLEFCFTSIQNLI